MNALSFSKEEGAPIRQIIFCFLLVFASISQASNSLLSALTEGWHADYVSLACSDNIMRSGSKLDRGLRDGSFVIHIFHRSAPYLPIKPKKQRLSFQGGTLQPHSWTFHTVLLNNKTIFDFDYTESPTPESFSSYFTKMWDHEELNQNYRFQIMPLNLYGNTDTDGTMNENLYPVLNFQELKLA